jgi:hypothetical protein
MASQTYLKTAIPRPLAAYDARKTRGSRPNQSWPQDATAVSRRDRDLRWSFTDALLPETELVLGGRFPHRLF